MTAQQAVKAYNDSGRVAWYHPRKKTISLNGFPAIPEREAIAKIQESLKRDENEFQRMAEPLNLHLINS